MGMTGTPQDDKAQNTKEPKKVYELAKTCSAKNLKNIYPVSKKAAISPDIDHPLCIYWGW